MQSTCWILSLCVCTCGLRWVGGWDKTVSAIKKLQFPTWRNLSLSAVWCCVFISKFMTHCLPATVLYTVQTPASHTSNLYSARLYFLYLLVLYLLSTSFSIGEFLYLVIRRTNAFYIYTPEIIKVVN